MNNGSIYVSVCVWTQGIIHFVSLAGMYFYTQGKSNIRLPPHNFFFFFSEKDISNK
jgi:hypothetical protein